MRRAVAGGAIISALIAIALLVGGNALSLTSTKWYSADITPKTASGGSQQPFTIKILNCGPNNLSPCQTSTQYLGSANVTFPSGYQLPQGPVAPVTTSGGETWTATVQGNVVKLRNPGPSNSNALAPGDSVSVTLTVTTPAGCGPTYPTTQAKQSNDFSGTGNDFTLVGSPLVVTIAPGALAGFSVAAIPSPQTVGPDNSFNVTATAKDACSNTVSTYAGGVLDNELMMDTCDPALFITFQIQNTTAATLTWSMTIVGHTVL